MIELKHVVIQTVAGSTAFEDEPAVLPALESPWWR
jgi:hypothetical protein